MATMRERGERFGHSNGAGAGGELVGRLVVFRQNVISASYEKDFEGVQDDALCSRHFFRYSRFTRVLYFKGWCLR